MFRALFCATLLVTLMVNIIFLFATKDKPPDPTAATPTLVSVLEGDAPSQARELDQRAPPAGHEPGRRLFLRSNDFYDYSAAAVAGAAPPDNNNQALHDNQSSQSSNVSAAAAYELPMSRARDSPRTAAERAAQMPQRARVFVAQQQQHGSALDSAAAANDKEIVVDFRGGGGRRRPEPLLQPPLAQAARLIGKEEIRIDNETNDATPTEPPHAPPRPPTITRPPNVAYESARQQRAATTGSRTELPEEEEEQNKAQQNKEGENKSSHDDGKELSSEITTETSSHKAANNTTGLWDHQHHHHHHHHHAHAQAPNSSTSQAERWLNIRVKSSRGHVLVRVDNLIIYESGRAAPAGGALEREDHQRGPRDRRAHLFQQHSSKRRNRRGGSLRADVRSPRRRRVLGTGDANLPASSQPQTTTTTTITTTSANDRPLSAAYESEAQDNEASASRGIHVLVLSQFDGRLMARRLFDTYTPGQDDELALFLRSISEGRVLVLAVRDEATFKMGRGSRARKLLARLGSRRIAELAWRDMWALVVVMVKQQLSERKPPQPPLPPPLAEGLGKSARFSEWGPAVEVSARFALLDPSTGAACAFARDSHQVRARRREFCARVEGYARVCDCDYPAALEFAPKPLDHSQLWDVPILVLASNRPHYLYRMLRSLLQAEGLDRSLITVHIDGFYDEPRQLCELLNVRYHQHAPQGTRSARISHHYKASLAATFERLFPQARAAILFEEDLDVAPDTLALFNHTRALLERDPSLYCVSAWNDQGYEHSVGAPGGLLRIETMPGLGWMLTRRLFLDELKPRWPPASQQHDWDMWIRTAGVRKGRECVIPDVSRTYHFGATGTNINAYFQRQYFAKHAWSGRGEQLLRQRLQSAAREFDDANTLERDNYERLLEAKLLASDDNPQQVIGAGLSGEIAIKSTATLTTMSKEALCSYGAYDGQSYNSSMNSLDYERPKDTNSTHEISDNNTTNNYNYKKTDKTSIVIYIKMIDSEDYKNWLWLAKCWRLWDLDARGQHKGLWRLYLHGRPVFVVGAPASQYAKFKPPQLLPYDF